MKNKTALLIGSLLALPLVLAADFFPVLDLFHLFVEQTFGNIFIAGVGLAILFSLILMMGKVSYGSMIFIVGCFLLVYGIGSFGALIAVPIFMGAFIYFVNGVLNLISQYK